jgi:hypothetical protein
MQSTPTPKPGDDPHDVVVVAPDAVRVAPADDELSNLLHEAAARYRSDAQARPGSDVPAGPAVPPLDTTFRPAAVNDVRVPGKGWLMARRAARGFIGLLLAVCIGLAAVAWRSYGDTVKKQIAKLTTQLVLTSSLPPEESAPAAQPAAPAIAAEMANAAAPSPAPAAQGAAETVAPAAASPDSAQLLQSMSRDLASLGQEVEQLKAGIAQLKAGQQQASRDVARPSEVKASEVKTSEQNLRPRKPPPPRPVAAPARKPVPPYPPRQAAAAPILPPAAAPYPAPAPYYASRQPDYLPRQPEPQPQVAVEPRAEPESSVPRPPLPLSPGIGPFTQQ